MKCGDIIRLEHGQTSKNLHSHDIQSPITRQNEVSAYGNDGEGDAGDNWKIECINPSTGLLSNSNDILLGSTVFQLKHVLTGGYLTCERRGEYTHGNCPNCPIVGDLEVIGNKRGGNSAAQRWSVHSGMFFPMDAAKSSGKDDDELLDDM